MLVVAKVNSMRVLKMWPWARWWALLVVAGALTLLLAGAAQSDDVKPSTGPEAPASVTASYPAGTSGSQLLLSWTAPTSTGDTQILRYEYLSNDLVGDDDGNAETATADDYTRIWRSLRVRPNHSCAANCAAIVSGLRQGNSYRFKIRAVTSAANGAESTPTLALTAATIPSATLRPTLTAADGTLTATWASPMSRETGGLDITDYDIRWRRSGRGSSNWSEAPDNLSSTGVVFEITGLDNCWPYYVQIRAQTPRGAGKWSSIASGTPIGPTAGPDSLWAAPAAIRTQPTGGAVDLIWAAPRACPGTYITDYDVRYKQTSDVKWFTHSGDLDDNPHSTALRRKVTDLINGTAYDFQVKADAGAAQGKWSDSVMATPAKAPETSAAPTLTVGDRSLGIAWQPPTEDGGATITDYDLRFRISDTDTHTDGNQPGDWTRSRSDSTDLTDTTDVIDRLANGRGYDVSVAARNSQGLGEWSAYASQTPAGAPKAPLSVRLGLPAGATGGQLELAWRTASALANGDPVDTWQYALNDIDADDDLNISTLTWADFGEWTMLDVDEPACTECTATISGLTNGRYYQVKLRATNSPGGVRADGLPSLPSSIRIPATSADTPTEVTVSYPQNTASTRLLLSWAAPASDGGMAVTRYEYLRNDIARNDDNDADTAAAEDYSTGWQSLRARPNPSCMSCMAIVADLTEAASYQFILRAVTGRGPGAVSEATAAFTAATIPSAPTRPTVTARDRAINVAWTAVNGNNSGGLSITDYDVRWRANGKWTEAPDGSENAAVSYEITDVVNCSRYSIQVRAESARGAGNWSSAASATPIGPPAAPSRVTARLSSTRSTADGGAVDLSWQAPRTCSGLTLSDYDVRYRIADTDDDKSSIQPGSWLLHSSDSPVDAASLATNRTVTGLVNGTVYDFQVKADAILDGTALIGVWSSIVAATPATTPDAPDVPTLVVGDRSLSVSWSAPSDGGRAITDFDVRYRITDVHPHIAGEQPGNWSRLKNGISDLTATRLAIDRLTNARSYDVSVAARNSQGLGGWSVQASQVPAGAPRSPRSLRVNRPDDGSGSTLVLVWSGENVDNGDPVDGWEYQINGRDADDDNDPFTASSSDYSFWRSLVVTPATCTICSATVTRLTDGKQYQFRVRATNSPGRTSATGSASLPSGWGTPAVTATAPQSVTAAYPMNTSGKQLVLTWSKPENDGGYAVTRYEYIVNDTSAHDDGDEGDGDAAIDFSMNWRSLSVRPSFYCTTKCTAVVSGLRQSRPYAFKIRAITQIGAGAPSMPTVVRTTASVPSAPSRPTLSARDGTLDVAWVSPTGTSTGGLAISDYDVRWRASGQWIEAPDTVNSTAVKYSITGLQNCLPYSVQVRAQSPCGVSKWSSTTRGTPTGPSSASPKAPSQPTTARGDGWLRLTWHAPATCANAQITDYDVRWRAFGASAWVTHSDDVSPDTSADLTRTRTITNLNNSTVYEVQVRAAVNSAESPWSIAIKTAAFIKPNKMSYIVVPHPDDEMQAWSLIEDSPDNYHVFVVLTRGEQTSYCSSPGHDAGTGEAAPDPWPAGKWTSTCELARENSFLDFLEGMGATDNGLPTDYTYRGSKGPFGAGGITLCRYDSGGCVSDRSADVWTSALASVVWFNLGDGDLTKEEVTWAIKAVRDNRALLGINSTLPNHNLIGASYWNKSYAGCYVYPHSDHRAVHEALWDIDFNVGYQAVASCESDPDASRTEWVTYAHFDDAFDTSGSTRLGEHVVHYGWLQSGNPGYWRGDYSGQDELFHRKQVFWVRFS